MPRQGALRQRAFGRDISMQPAPWKTQRNAETTQDVAVADSRRVLVLRVVGVVGELPELKLDRALRRAKAVS